MITVLFFLLYLIFYFVVEIGVSKQKVKEQLLAESSSSFKLSEVCLLIPFRNEDERLIGILSSLIAVENLPKTIVFINDHSDDKSIEVLQNSSIASVISLLHLPDGITGKKQAIRYGMKHFQSEYYLTMDADVCFKPNYFEHLCSLPKVDLLILPVIFTSKTFWKRYFELDVLLINALNRGVSGWGDPIVASGANLLFRATVFNEHDSIQKHQHISSGDDIFLLADFKKASASICLVNSIQHAVFTETPSSIREYLQQRLRWFSKTSSVKDTSANLVLGVQAVLTFLFLLVITTTLVNNNWIQLIEIFVLKVLIDTVFFHQFFIHQQRIKSLIFLPLYEVFFPIFSVFVFLCSFKRTIVWKGREVVKR